MAPNTTTETQTLAPVNKSGIKVLVNPENGTIDFSVGEWISLSISGKFENCYQKYKFMIQK